MDALQIGVFRPPTIPDFLTEVIRVHLMPRTRRSLACNGAQLCVSGVPKPRVDYVTASVNQLHLRPLQRGAVALFGGSTPSSVF
eukprot:6209852-Pleurochrysis_carterae.AAC.2